MPAAIGPQPAPLVAAAPACAEEYWIEGEAVRALYADEPSLRSLLGQGPTGAAIRTFVDWRQWALPGAYLLLWPADVNDRTPVYVGSTGDLLNRLNGHSQTGWTHAIAVTGHGLVQGAALQLEQGLGKALMAADPGQTVWTKAWSAHPSFDGSQYPWELSVQAIVLVERVLRIRGVLSLTFDPAEAAK